MKRRCKWALVGIPDQAGVAGVGGRLGAAFGPAAFRAAFARLSGIGEIREGSLFDQDIDVENENIQLNHDRAATTVCHAQNEAGTTIVIGGGHDHGFSQLRGVFEALKPKRLGCINLDAHLDLRPDRPVITSGSPFYLAIERGIVAPENLVEFGVQEQCNSPALWEYARKKKIPTYLFSELRHLPKAKVFSKVLRALEKRCDQIVISFDLDSVSEAYAPGVSAPVPEGFSPSEIFEFLELAGHSRKVCSLGVFELNPLHDDRDKTARLAAHAVARFLGSRFLDW